MINGIILTFFITLLGTINLDFYLLKNGTRIGVKNYLKGWAQNLIYGSIIAAVIAYVAMPAIVFPDIIVPILLVLIANAIVTIARHARELTGAIFSFGSFGRSSLKKGNVTIPIFILISIILLWMLSPYIPLTQTEQLNALTQAKTSYDLISSIDPQKIRQVPLEFAEWKADKIIGELGNRYYVSYLNIQVLKDRLVWVAPLEFSNIWKWLQFRTSPGYIVVDGENPQQEVQKVTSKKMRYLESAYFQNNIYRHVYQQFPQYRLSEFSLEIDEEGNPWWTISAVVPTVWSSGEQVLGLILVNPETGDMQFFNLDAVPVWVDRVIPETVAEDYNVWFGAYKHGYFNTLFTQKDMHLPTTKFGSVDVFAVRSGADLVWFTGHTSPSNADQSMVGYSTMNTRTGEFIYYANVSGYYNENAALSNANSKVSNFEGYHGTQPVFYNLFGELSWVIPILSSNNELQRIAIVHAKTGNVILGETLDAALKEYRLWLSNNGITVSNVAASNNEDLITQSGTIARIATNYLILKEDHDHVFDLRFVTGVEKELSKEGDRVKISYERIERISTATSTGTNVSSGTAAIEARAFDNLDLNLGKGQ